MLAMLAAAGWRLTRETPAYVRSVPVTLTPDDPRLWSLVNADSFEAARAIAPDLPDPAQLPSIGEAAASAVPVDLSRLKMEAYVGPASRSYAFRGATPEDSARAQYCLTAALYYEAASETDDGMRGVAQVVLNRARHPSFPGSVCGVVFQGSQRAIVCQFTFACDGSMARRPTPAVWARAGRIAAEALAGRVFAPVGLATHYHTLAVWPSWGKTLAMTNIVGAHIFHRWRGRYGEPLAFSRPYTGREPAPGPYLPISSQLAARSGRPVPAATDPLAGPLTGPAAMPGLATAAAGSGMTDAGRPAPLPATVPASTAVPGAATMPYADPRLQTSGSVRDEYRTSGAAIAR